MKDSDLLQKWMNFLACVTGLHHLRLVAYSPAPEIHVEVRKLLFFD